MGRTLCLSGRTIMGCDEVRKLSEVVDVRLCGGGGADCFVDDVANENMETKNKPKQLAPADTKIVLS